MTEKIADYVTRHLLPLADLVLDFHSGGRTLDFLPYAAAHALPDKAQEARCFDAVAAFAAPFSMRMIEIDAVGMYDTTAEAMGKVFVTTELGGGGTATRAQRCGIAKRGVAQPAASMPASWPARPEAGADALARHAVRRLLRLRRGGRAGRAAEDLGEPVRTGRGPVPHPSRSSRTGAAPLDHRAAIDGVLAARHFPGLVKTGDCLTVLADGLGSAPDRFCNAQIRSSRRAERCRFALTATAALAALTLGARRRLRRDAQGRASAPASCAAPTPTRCPTATWTGRRRQGHRPGRRGRGAEVASASRRSTWTVTPFGSLIPGLKARRFDLVGAEQNILPDRCKQVAFTEPNSSYGEGLLVQGRQPEEPARLRGHQEEPGAQGRDRVGRRPDRLPARA